MSENEILNGGKKSNPSPLVYDKHKEQCVYRTTTILNGEANEDQKCVVELIFVDDGGYIRNAGLIKKSIPELEKGVMKKINAIVLHRTDSSTEQGPLVSFSNGIGTHFLIAKNGDIYQTASLFSYTSHVGKIKSRCQAENTWSEAERKIIESFGWNPKKLYNHEKEKEYPSRYPYNVDSIGIEVVALYDKKVKEWGNPASEQKNSISTLVDILINIYELSEEDIYEHDRISYKTAGEGAGLYSVD
ncbi:peptidoglycan recognition protein family protein [Intestinirhabdus alba]|jgi:hypothetical protein|uniref:N-acetylmuramoyl-L-alanine amidase n=1 Tax=Intestinirhabdus alba TaxID=2899544 RepID=A0A6L6ISN3_9ENTR|nr:N-acetylmuramoyl-L-alanine amidase [Intestinirhabdus alba]MTH48748.1 N-acetylmuramoyl-L-alanine amidase [Intestinirhabdus alba]